VLSLELKGGLNILEQIQSDKWHQTKLADDEFDVSDGEKSWTW
jgi:hypothetical protein